jgi:hypothetical protein
VATCLVAGAEYRIDLAGVPPRAVIRERQINTNDLVADLLHSQLVAIDRDTLRELIDAADVLREDDTHLAGWIRILALGDSILVQEETPKGEVLVRRMASRESANSFVDLRMQSYERMWDGCGCKVDYYAEGSDGSDDPDRRFRTRGRVVRSPVVVLSILTVLAAPPIRADSPQIPQRFYATARWGTFEEMDSPALLRKDGEPGNLVLGWAGSQQAGAALGFEILPGLTLDVGGAEVLSLRSGCGSPRRAPRGRC